MTVLQLRVSMALFMWCIVEEAIVPVIDLSTWTSECTINTLLLSTCKEFDQKKWGVTFSSGPFTTIHLKQSLRLALVMADCVTRSLEWWTGSSTLPIPHGKEKDLSVPGPSPVCLGSRDCGVTLVPHSLQCSPWNLRAPVYISITVRPILSPQD